MKIDLKGENKMAEQGPKIFVILFFSALLILIICLFVFRIVGYDEYAVEKEWGKLKPTVHTPGVTYVGVGGLIRVNNQVRNYEILVTAASKDMQNINIILNVNLRIKEDKVYDFVKNYPNEETYTLYLNNKIQEKIKTRTLQYNAEQFLFEREAINEDFFNSISNIEDLEYFEIRDIALKDVDYSEEFNKALERKAQLEIERDIIKKQKENMVLIKENLGVISADDYFKYMVAEKWDGQSPLTIIK